MPAHHRCVGACLLSRLSEPAAGFSRSRDRKIAELGFRHAEFPPLWLTISVFVSTRRSERSVESLAGRLDDSRGSRTDSQAGICHVASSAHLVRTFVQHI